MSYHITFVNEYRYDDDFFKHYFWDMHCHQLVSPVDWILAAVVFGEALAAIGKPLGGIGARVAFLFALVIPCYMVVITILRYRRSYNMRIERCRTLGIPRDTLATVTVDDQKGVMDTHSARPAQSFAMSEVRSWFETRDFFYLIFNGSISLAASKTGFVKGTAEQYRAFLSRFPKDHPARPWLIGVYLAALGAVLAWAYLL